MVLIHGIHATRSSRDEMSATWTEAIGRGLRNVRSPRAASLTYECAFYGHLYNDGKAARLHPKEMAELDEPAEGFELDFLMAMGTQLPPQPDQDDDGKLYLPSAVQATLRGLQATVLSGWPQNAVLALVREAHRFLADQPFRERVREEVSAAMAAEPRIVVGHSLGSVVALDWLARCTPEPAPHLITLGSPLGFAGIRRRVASGFPRGAAGWTNIAAREDAVATVKELAPLYDDRVRDQACRNPRGEAHAAERYLANVRFAEAVDELLG